MTPEREADIRANWTGNWSGVRAVDELLAEVDALRAKLGRYGRHEFGCGAGIFPGANCTCGFAPSEPSS